MNEINDPTFNDLTLNYKYDIEINSLMNNYSLETQYDSIRLLHFYINGSKINEVYKQNVSYEDYKKFLLLDLYESNTTETSEIYKNNDQISNCDADITTNSTVKTFNQPLHKKYKTKVSENRIINTKGTSEMCAQTNLKSNCEVDIETTDHENTSKRTLKKLFKEPTIINYIYISSDSKNETYEDDVRNAKYYGFDIQTNSSGSTSQQTSKEDYENSEYVEIITVSPSEIYEENNQECNYDSNTDINSPGNTSNQTVQEEVNTLNVFDNTPFSGLKKANIIANDNIEKLKNDSKYPKNKCSNNVNRVYSTLNAHDDTLSEKCVINQEERHGRLPVIMSVQKQPEYRLRSKYVLYNLNSSNSNCLFFRLQTCI